MQTRSLPQRTREPDRRRVHSRASRLQKGQRFQQRGEGALVLQELRYCGVSMMGERSPAKCGGIRLEVVIAIILASPSSAFCISSVITKGGQIGVGAKEVFSEASGEGGFGAIVVGEDECRACEGRRGTLRCLSRGARPPTPLHLHRGFLSCRGACEGTNGEELFGECEFEVGVLFYIGCAVLVVQRCWCHAANYNYSCSKPSLTHAKIPLTFAPPIATSWAFL